MRESWTSHKGSEYNHLPNYGTLLLSVGGLR